jgi:hypothetical protein
VAEAGGTGIDYDWTNVAKGVTGPDFRMVEEEEAEEKGGSRERGRVGCKSRCLLCWVAKKEEEKIHTSHTHIMHFWG